ncbi:MAG TPA: S8 family serine peptidase, partial [Acidimicrobiales bacterium]|nr:S8 family serine peptidase [Acidimicrobiales bacterium]
LTAGLIGLAAAPAADAATNDPFRVKQWGLDKIEADAAWPTADGTGAIIAIVDTGVDLGHPDLSAKLLSFSDADFSEPAGTCTSRKGVKTCTQDGAQDKNGHGTHVAGIAGAITNNGVGVSGTAPGAKILPVRVLDASGSGTIDQIASGIRYAADKGADVISLSLGEISVVGNVLTATGTNDPVISAINYAWSKGSLAVIAAGNDSFPYCAEPAATTNVICVGATDRNDLRSYYSNSDATMTKTYVVAPGGAGGLFCADDIYSTWLRTATSYCSGGNVGYEAIAGTSMATPFVSGVAAILAGKGYTNAQIVSKLVATTDDLGSPGRDSIYGYGRVNARKASVA